MTLPPQLSPDYRFLAIIGHPVEYSLSPFMHNLAFQTLGMQCLYSAYDIEPASLREAVNDLRKLGFIGFNVTLPHKESVLSLLDDTDYEAKTIGAVNTVSLQEGRLIGYNTDVFGVLKSLEPLKSSIEGSKVLVLGSGGACRAVLYALKKYFPPSLITVATRSEEKAKAIIASLKIEDARVVHFSLANLSPKEFSLIVNATPVGMAPKTDDSPLSPSFEIFKHHIVFDLIYRPLETTLLKRAREAGAKTIGGLEMFINQGAKAFEIWTAEKMPVDEVRKALEEKLKA
ncbi:MAG: shikimate dehydrogenase [Ignavibacteriales bacterium]|nr:shikimate dehydrogenase [Ignavibacteriales bacterium]